MCGSMGVGATPATSVAGASSAATTAGGPPGKGKGATQVAGATGGGATQFDSTAQDALTKLTGALTALQAAVQQNLTAGTSVATATGGGGMEGCDMMGGGPGQKDPAQKDPGQVAGDQGPGQKDPGQGDVAGDKGPGGNPGQTDVAGDKGPGGKPGQTDVAGDAGPGGKPGQTDIGGVDGGGTEPAKPVVAQTPVQGGGMTAKQKAANITAKTKALAEATKRDASLMANRGEENAKLASLRKDLKEAGSGPAQIGKRTELLTKINNLESKHRDTVEKSRDQHKVVAKLTKQLAELKGAP